MSDIRSERQADNAAQGMAKASADSQLRLAAEEGASVFPDDVQPTDEAPTIISKNPPAQAATATAIKPMTPEMLLGSLRGRKLAHFELLEPIGVGGMAAVLRARDTHLDRNVALKILPPDMAHDDENIRRFHQEARAAAKLDHENIARVFYCGEDQNLHFIAFEYVEGENLRTILERRRRLPVAEAVRYILQIAAGLEHAATRGVVHRDVKPSNIIITPTGRAKLVDMGLARSLEPQTNQLTQSGMTLGTFDYISPEQALEPREADARSDIYSLGCTFYHMLTGQAPVPEGTAAKKMHHHQNVAPIDPRQLNPDVPDEVAFVLHKMMAKNPKDRYQRPVQLVQHLMQIANQVGAAADMPEGVLFVDAPLLSPPRKRPLVLISAGALALAALLMVLSLAPPQKPPGGPTRPQKDEAKGGKDSGSTAAKPAVPIPPVSVKGGAVEVKDEQDLRNLFADTTSSSVKAIVVKNIVITQPGLLFQGGELRRSLILEGKVDEEEDPANRPIDERSLPMLSWKYEPNEANDIAALFFLDGGTITFKNLRLSIEAPLKMKQAVEQTVADLKIPKHPVAGVAVRGAASVRFLQCIFEQPDVPPPPYVNVRHLGVPLASVLAYGAVAKSDRPQIDFQQCVFKSGQVAVGLESPADVAASQCGFMPHGAMFHLHGDGESKIALTHCSAFVVTGPVFRLDDTASCKLQIDYSIFSCPSNTVSDRDMPHLIYQTDRKEPHVAFMQPWKRNCYHNLNAMWSRPSDEGATIIGTLEEFQREIGARNGRDAQSTSLTDSTNIWRVAAPHTKKSAKGAFRLNPEVREVRTNDQKKSPLGVEINDLVDVALAPFKEEPNVAVEMNPNPGERIVDPTLEGRNLPAGVYESVNQALSFAKPGDVIRIKHGKKRQLNVEAAWLKKSGVKVTLRPFDEQYHPILTLAETPDPNAYFFRLHDGEMIFEQLEIELEPDQPGFVTQTLVLLDANASCTFKNCIITLKPNAEKNPNRTVPLSVVTLSNDEAMMMMVAKPARSAPEAIFENCFIRGEGEVVTNLAGRPLDLQLNNTLVGLTGSLMTVQAGVKEAAMDAQVKLGLQKSSIFTTEPMLVIKQGKNRHAKGLPPVRVDRTNISLFAALEDKPLVSTDLPELTEANLRSYFDWKGASDNFSGYEKLLEDFSGFAVDKSKWQATFYQGAQMQNVRVTLPPAPRKLWEAVPDDFKPKGESSQRYGAALGNDQLPPFDRKTKSE